LLAKTFATGSIRQGCKFLIEADYWLNSIRFFAELGSYVIVVGGTAYVVSKLPEQFLQ